MPRLPPRLRAWDLSIIKAIQHDSTILQRQSRKEPAHTTLARPKVELSSMASADTNFPQLELDAPVAF
jgi:hypothetical protein